MINCKNCKKALSIDSSYCNACGGRVVRNRLTFRNLFEHITETFFNFDNKLLRTFIDLFIKPERVIVGYISGVRRQYVNPISYLALVLTVGGLYIIVLNKFFPDALAGMSNPYGVKGQEKIVKNTMSIMSEYYSIVMVLFVPVYALFSRLVFINRKEYNYTEHIVMAMYIIAQFSLVSSILNIVCLVCGINASVLGFFSIFFQIGFFAYCYKRIYKISTAGIILRTLFFFGILAVIMVLLIIAGVVFAIIFKDNPAVIEFMESQKAVYESQLPVKDSIN